MMTLKISPKLKTRRGVSISVEDHLKMAKHLAEAKLHLMRLFADMQKFYSKTALKPYRVLQPGMGGQMSVLTSVLDDSWHALISDEEHAKYGHIYYVSNEVRWGNDIT